MKITTISTKEHNPRLNVIQIVGELTGHGALELKRYLFNCLEEGKSYLLISLKYAKRIDGLGISVLEQIIERNIHIRLFGVGAEIRWMFGASGKEALFKIYNVADGVRAISLIEEEMQEEAEKDVITKRQHLRVNTSFKADFKYHPSYNGVISCRANIMNLSEGGALIDRILAMDTTTGEMLFSPEISGEELYDMEFRLDEDSEPIRARGECVRQTKENEAMSVGIRFNDIKREHKDMIRGYVVETLSV